MTIDAKKEHLPTTYSVMDTCLITYFSTWTTWPGMVMVEWPRGQESWVWPGGRAGWYVFCCGPSGQDNVDLFFLVLYSVNIISKTLPVLGW